MQETQIPSSAEPAPPVAANSKPARAALISVFLVVSVDLLGFGIVLPLLPRYAEELIPEGTTPLVIGLVIGGLMSSFSAMQFLFAPVWGSISDRLGRRPILLIGLAGSVVFYAMFGLVSEWLSRGWLVISLLLASRIGAGLSGATISTAAAVIADSTPKEKRSQGMALIGAAFGIGFTFGPLIAWAGFELLPQYRGAAGYLAALLCFFALLFAWRRMPETLPPGGTHTKRSLLNMSRLFETLKTPTVGLLVFAFFLTTFGFANFEGTISLLTKGKPFALTDRENYLVFAYIGFVLMFTQGLIYRRLAKKLPDVTLMRIGIVGMFLGLGGIAAMILTGMSSLPLLLTVVGVCVFGFSFLNPSLNGLISKRSDPHRQGEVLGINQSFSALARILGPVIGVVLFSVETSHAMPYLFAAALLGLVLALLSRLKPG